MVKQQQMRWTQRGAHLLLQIRTQALNGDLRGNFCRWYPGMERDSRNQDGMVATAYLPPFCPGLHQHRQHSSCEIVCAFVVFSERHRTRFLDPGLGRNPLPFLHSKVSVADTIPLLLDVN